jgi:hypothetical protein
MLDRLGAAIAYIYTYKRAARKVRIKLLAIKFAAGLSDD